MWLGIGVWEGTDEVEAKAVLLETMTLLSRGLDNKVVLELRGEKETLLHRLGASPFHGRFPKSRGRAYAFARQVLYSDPVQY